MIDLVEVGETEEILVHVRARRSQIGRLRNPHKLR